MSLYEYSLQYEPDKSGRAQSYDLNASYKDLTQVLAAVKGLPIEKAREKLEGAIEMRKAIAYRRFNKGLGHRSELGGKKGRYPKKECLFAMELLNNAVANAKAKGLDEKKLVVLHACAYKQNVFPRYRRFFASSVVLGYGKQAVFSSYATARAELHVGEKDAKKMDLTPRGRNKRNKLEKMERKAKKQKKNTPIASTATPAISKEKTEAKPATAPQPVAQTAQAGGHEKHEHKPGEANVH